MNQKLQSNTNTTKQSPYTKFLSITKPNYIRFPLISPTELWKTNLVVEIKKNVKKKKSHYKIHYSKIIKLYTIYTYINLLNGYYEYLILCKELFVKYFLSILES